MDLGVLHMILRGHFGPVLAYLWDFGGHFDLFGPILSPFEPILGLFWPFLGVLEAILTYLALF